MSETTGHFALAALVITAYTVLTVLGHDGTALIGVLGGQGASAAISKATRK